MRDNIFLYPLRSTMYGLQGLGGLPNLSAWWTALADIRRGDGTGGVLVQSKVSGLYALWTGVGSIETLPQYKIAPALAMMGTA